MVEEKKPNELTPEISSPAEPVKIAIPKELIRKKRFPKILIFLIIVFILIGAIFLLSHFNLWQIKGKKVITNQPIFAPPAKITPPSFDTDSDGLTDDEEKNLGTNLNNPDTDNDGLFDFEEVKVYQTNPIDPDTDKDGYKDGEEVKAGYNPKDPTPGAKLFDFKAEVEKLSQ